MFLFREGLKLPCKHFIIVSTLVVLACCSAAGQICSAVQCNAFRAPLTWVL